MGRYEYANSWHCIVYLVFIYQDFFFFFFYKQTALGGEKWWNWFVSFKLFLFLIIYSLLLCDLYWITSSFLDSCGWFMPLLVQFKIYCEFNKLLLMQIGWKAIIKSKSHETCMNLFYLFSYFNSLLTCISFSRHFFWLL